MHVVRGLIILTSNSTSSAISQYDKNKLCIFVISPNFIHRLVFVITCTVTTMHSLYITFFIGVS